jgi:hypothetical protein
MHDETTTNGWYIGNDPQGSTCVGANDALFENFEHAITLAGPCGSQYAVTFINAAGGVINNVNSTTTTSQDYYFDAGPPNTFGWPGIQYPASSASVLTYSDPGEIRFSGHNGIDIYQSNLHDGLNLQFLLDTGSIYMRASTCSDTWWNTSTQLWDIGQNGSGDTGCVLYGNGWTGLAVRSGTPGSTISQATLNSSVALATSPNGRTFFGQNIIGGSSGGINVTDNGATVQVQGPATGTIFGSGVSSNTDQVGEFSLSAATTATVSWSGTYTSHPECNLTPQFDLGSGVRQYITYTGVASFTANYTSAVTGTVGYTCHYRN